MIVNKMTKEFISRNDKPNENWLNDDGYFVVNDNSSLSDKIKEFSPYFDFVMQDGVLSDVVPVEPPLDVIADRKRVSFNDKAKKSIINGFISSNGKGYRLTIEDQLNMQGQKDVLEADESITEVNWMTIDDEAITHTREEWLQVYREAFKHKNDCIWKNKQLRDKVNQATTIEEVEAIQW